MIFVLYMQHRHVPPPPVEICEVALLICKVKEIERNPNQINIWWDRSLPPTGPHVSMEHI